MPTLSVRRESLPLRRPFSAAWGEIRSRELVRVGLEWAESDWGEGEAAPLEAYDGVPTPAVLAALDAYGTVLDHMAPDASHAELVEACRAERDLPRPSPPSTLPCGIAPRAGRVTPWPNSSPPGLRPPSR